MVFITMNKPSIYRAATNLKSSEFLINYNFIELLKLSNLIKSNIL